MSKNNTTSCFEKNHCCIHISKIVTMYFNLVTTEVFLNTRISNKITKVLHTSKSILKINK